jgi:hypothetical protein
MGRSALHISCSILNHLASEIEAFAADFEGRCCETKEAWREAVLACLSNILQQK